MGLTAGDVSTAERWGPVCRGFNVSLPSGESGRVAEIRLRDGGVELLVESASSRRLVAVDGADVEAILPRTQRIVIHASSVEEDAGGVAAVGGIIRMPARHSPRPAEPRGEAA